MPVFPRSLALSPSSSSLTSPLRSTIIRQNNARSLLLRRQQPRQHQSTTAIDPPYWYNTKLALKLTIATGATLFAGYYVTDTRSSAHRYIAVPLLRFFVPDAEDAHAIALAGLKGLWDYGVHPRDRSGERDEKGGKQTLQTKLWDFTLANPIYISAGLDKHAEAVDALFALGPSIVEVGCVTPKPQPGNDKPRVFRLVRDSALINRYGFNSDGAFVVARRLRERVTRFANEHGLSEQTVLNTMPASLIEGKLLAVQIGKNKEVSENGIEAVRNAYKAGVRELGLYADIIVVNVSSPNTPGLRKLQGGKTLTDLLSAVVAETKKLEKTTKPKVIVKISPDESSPQQISDITRAIIDAKCDGVVVANTTLRRPETLVSPDHIVHEQGGLSGPELYKPMVSLVREYRRRLPADKEVWASGGVGTGADALGVLREGAGMVGVYTALTYGGVGTIGRIKEEIRSIVGEYTKGRSKST